MTGTWRRYVAVGDSLSEGLGDPLPGGGIRGWAARLAERLRQQEPDLQFTNLAVRGHTVRQALATQLQPALELRPDLVTVFIGGNDVLLRPRFSAQRFADDLARLVTPFARPGTTLVLSTLPDLTACSPVPHPFRALLRRRIAAANAQIRRVAEATGALLLDAEADERTRRHAMWSVDRIHPSAEGHRLIALGVAELLGLPTREHEPALQPADPRQVLRRYGRELAWLARHGLHTAARG